MYRVTYLPRTLLVFEVVDLYFKEIEMYIERCYCNIVVMQAHPYRASNVEKVEVIMEWHISKKLLTISELL